MALFVFKIVTCVLITLIGLGVSILMLDAYNKEVKDGSILGYWAMIIVFVMALVSIWL